MNIILFCFQAYNDIDHLVPIASKIAQDRSDVKVVGVVFSAQDSFEDDFRLGYLAQLGSDVRWLLSMDFMGLNKQALAIYKWGMKKANSSQRFSVQGIAARLIRKAFGQWLERQFANFDASLFLEAVAQMGSLRAVIHDHVHHSPQLNSLVKVAKDRGVYTAAAPHAVYTTENLINTSAYLDPFLSPEPEPYIVDHVFMVNDNEIKARKRLLMDERQAVVLGSARFCKEWVSTLRRISPKVQMPSAAGLFKIVIMVGRADYNVFVEEVHRIVEFVSRIPGVFLVVKPATRDPFYTGAVLKKNVAVVGNEVPSADLIDWADLVLFSLTSVVFDAVRLDKPVLYLRRTVANVAITESAITSWNVDCRDDLRDRILELKDKKTDRTYTRKERDVCLKKLIEPAGPDVLGKYASFILESSGL